MLHVACAYASSSGIALDSHSPVLYFARAQLLLELRFTDMALKSLEWAIALDSQNAEYYCTRGRVLTSLKQFDAALRDMEAAVLLAPQNSTYRHWRGRLFREKERHDEALREFDAAVQFSGDDVDYVRPLASFVLFLMCAGLAEHCARSGPRL